MSKEIERKFLVQNQAFKTNASRYLIRQGYWSSDREKPVRVRVVGSNAWLNLKAGKQGIERHEFEYAIPLEDAHVILNDLCMKPLIEKYRYITTYAGKTWEVDEFTGANTGLIMAEIELTSDEEHVELPSWIGREVTNDERYYNAYLATHPYRRWG